MTHILIQLNLHDRKDKRVEYRVLIFNFNPFVVRAKKITDSISSSLLISANHSLVHNLSIIMLLTIIL